MFLQKIVNKLLALIEKYHPFNFRYFKLLITVVMIILLGMVLFLGVLSTKKITEIVTEDFNQQQLMLAKHAASQIENSIELLKREITLLSLSPAIQYSEKPALINRMNITFSSVKYEGVREIKLIEAKTQKAYRIIEGKKCLIESINQDEKRFLKWASEEKNKGQIFFTEITPCPDEENSKTLIMKMIIPVWQISIDESHPVPTNKFSGALIFTVDVTYLVSKVTKKIRSGKTGYAWVIDKRGIFLYHEEQSFIGQNAFEARKGKKPTISFTRINEIQREKMLKGEEGTSWYISGWHRGMEGEIKKLIAFAPIKLKEPPNSIMWSIAVVAPISEVEGAIQTVHTQQMILQGIIVIIILLGGLFINFILVTWSNILEREVTKKTDELKKSEEKYKSLIENAEDIIFTVDSDGKIVSMNKFGLEFFKKQDTQIFGQPISEVFLPDGVILAIKIKQIFKTGQSSQITHRVFSDGRDYWFNTNLRALKDEKGNIYSILGIARDITDRKKMEEQSYYTEKLASLGTLAAGVAHEINNPLAIILGFTDLLIEKTPPQSEQYDILKTIEKQATNAKRIVENLLSFVRHREQKEQPVDINECIESVVDVMNNTITINNIEIKKELQKNLPHVKGNAGELQQVFFNIINNAIHVMKGGGVLTISTGYDGQWIEVCISDTGCGIPKEHRHRIFDPFFTTKEVGKGTGLGLWVSYNIIKKHNGIITFETKTKEESETTGTKFIIKLPASKE
ncbi:PAS domain S-box-containing protein [Thermodesulfovibrio aggregans]|uniref:histidine kinase n=1 Tax=Thermodesulfovibrio aggregans TaxID=86166 RepID=A0A0U9HLH0_9BACT|nr:sensor histidine kinase [Thermodesulfovibrio aggregans]GAQ93851.1 PAS domain S-box-containing protein [Thermodesulfovibrio aggregans]